MSHGKTKEMSYDAPGIQQADLHSTAGRAAKGRQSDIPMARKVHGAMRMHRETDEHRAGLASRLNNGPRAASRCGTVCPGQRHAVGQCDRYIAIPAARL